MNTIFVDPGRMRRELRLQKLVPIADGAGGYTEAWQETAVVFAAVEPVSARSVRAAAQDIEAVTHRITVRHRAGISAGMRFEASGRHFSIRTVFDPDGTERYLVCMAREEQP